MPNYKGISPVLRHAMESFEHGVFHYLDGTEISRKFAFLHIDHAIELILKEYVVRLGESLYRKDGKTIGLYDAYSILETKGVFIPEKPRLEDLHDFRNIVQHKGLTPDEQTTEFYVIVAYKFVKRFLHDELALELDLYLPHAYTRTMEGVETIEGNLSNEVKKRLLDSEQLFSSGTYEMAVISAFTALEISLRRKFQENQSIPLVNLFRQLVDNGKVKEEVWIKFKHATKLRNKAAHTGGGISKSEARKALDDLNSFVEILPNL
ncbi:MAG: hypothetical protein ACYC36_08700 [Bellilinea sp.]